MKVEIPVHPISKKILLKDYGDKYIDNRDLFFMCLHFNKVQSSGSFKWHRKILTETIQVNVNEKLAKNLLENGYEVGHMMLQLHFDRMLNFIYAQWLADVDAYKALRSFYALHDINEDDFAQSSAYKKWQRFIKKEKIAEKTDLFSLKQESSVLSSGQVSAKRLIPPTSSEIRTLIGLVITHSMNFFFKTDQINQLLFKHLYIYAHCEYGKRDKKEFAEAINRSLRNVNYSIEQFRKLMETYPEIREGYEKALKTLENPHYQVLST